MVAILGANSVSGGYEVSNSLRFNNDDSPELSRTPSSEGNKKTFTFSTWLKRSALSSHSGSASSLLVAGVSTNILNFRFQDSGTLNCILSKSGSTSNGFSVETDALFRDPSAWYHIVLVVDTTQASITNAVKIYVNNTLQSFSSSSYGGGQNVETPINDDLIHSIGYNTIDNNQAFDGYMTEVHLIDGTAKAQTDFGKLDDNGVWIPIKYTGTYGTNGFFLEFQQTGTSANSSGIGADTSGNDNHFAVTNLASTDVTEDTCTNNFCTLNPLSAGSDIRANGSFLEGNTELINGGTSGQSSNQRCQGTMGFTNGKWYWEAKLVSNTMTVGIIDSDVQTSGSVNYSGLNNARYDSETGNVTNSGGTVYTGSTYDNGDIIGIAVDADNGYVYFAKNGTYQNSGDPTSGSSGTGGASITLGNFILPLISDNSSGSAGRHQHNFGNPPYAVSSSNNDGKYGNFEYAPPSGYYALCTKRLAEFG